MESVNYKTFSDNINNFMNKVNEDNEPVIINRDNGKSAVLISFEDFLSSPFYDETAYLMSSEENVKRLNESIRQIRNGEVVKHGLMEE